MQGAEARRETPAIARERACQRGVVDRLEPMERGYADDALPGIEPPARRMKGPAEMTVKDDSASVSIPARAARALAPAAADSSRAGPHARRSSAVSRSASWPCSRRASDALADRQRKTAVPSSAGPWIANRTRMFIRARLRLAPRRRRRIPARGARRARPRENDSPRHGCARSSGATHPRRRGRPRPPRRTGLGLASPPGPAGRSHHPRATPGMPPRANATAGTPRSAASTPTMPKGSGQQLGTSSRSERSSAWAA